MTDDTPFFKTIAKGGIIMTGGNVILKIFAILATVIILRYISVYDYGLWKLILAVLGSVGLLTLPNIENFLIADMARELGRKREDMYTALFQQASFLIFALGCAAAVGLFFAAPVISFFTKLSITFPLQILSLSFVFSAIQRIYFIVFYSRLEFLHVQGMKILYRAAYLAALPVLIFYFELGFMSIVYAYVFSLALPLMVYAIHFAKLLRGIWRAEYEVNFSLWRAFKTHGKWALLTTYAEDIVGSVRPWIIGYFLGVEAVAIIMAAQSLFGEIVNAVPLSQILAPIIPREVDRENRFRLIIERSIKYSLWFFVAAGIVAFFVVPPLVGVLFPNYVSAIPLFSVILLALPAVPFSILTTQAFYALKAQRELFISTVTPRAVTIPVVLPLFLKAFGMMGAVAEYIITAYSIAFMRMRSLRRIAPEFRFSLATLIQFDTTDRIFAERILNFFLGKKS